MEKQQSLKDFFSLISEGKEQQKQEELERSTYCNTSDLSGFFSFIADKTPPKPLQIEEQILPKVIPEHIIEVVEQEKEEDLISATTKHITKTSENYTNFFTQPDAKKPDPSIKAIQNKVKYLEDWLTKVSLLGPGSGEVRLLNLDDVDTSNLSDQYYLNYNESSKKIEFSNVYSILSNETLDTVTTRGNTTNNGIVVSSVGFTNGTQFSTDSDSNIMVTGNLIASNADFNLGSLTNYWGNAYFGPHSVQILPDTSNGTIITLQNDNDILQVESGGFSVFDSTGTYYTFQTDINGYSEFRTPSPLLGKAVLNVSGNPSSNIIPLVSTSIGGILHLTGPDQGPSILTIDNFDDSNPTNFGSSIVLRRMRNTVDNPYPVLANDMLGFLAASGYGANTGAYTQTGFPGPAISAISFRSTEDHTPLSQGSKIELSAIANSTNTNVLIATINPSGNTPGIVLNQSKSGITFTDGTFQNTAYHTANSTSIGGVKPDNTTITINNGTITCVGVSGNGTGTDYIEVYDRSNTISINSSPELLIPSSYGANVGITYDNTTGIFTFPNAGNFSLSLVVNATASTSGQSIYIYAEQNTGSGWVVNQNSGKKYDLNNNQDTQVVYAQAVHRSAGQQIRYKIYSNDGKVSLLTNILPGVTPSVYVPAIRIQYA